MACVNSASLRDEFDGYKADIDSLRKEGKISKEADVVFSGMCRLLGILIAIFLEKTTKKTSTNSSTPPSQTDKDETKKSSKMVTIQILFRSNLLSVSNNLEFSRWHKFAIQLSRC